MYETVNFRINEQGVKSGITEDQHARCIRSVGINDSFACG